MADLGHLEKMGRELKCPICLSLLNSAASLGCNHVFCNSCILESMKSGSDCPVCKVPFRRREVRLAPHMDNLVSIYKSMELASGVNILTTQTATSVKKLEIGLARSNDEKPGKPVMKAANGGKVKGRKSTCKQQKLEKADVKSLATKRVHVTPFPVTETPVRPKKVPKSGNPLNKLGNDGAFGENKSLTADKQGDTMFSPFFWLRGEDDDDKFPENLSAQKTQDAPPPGNAPCFSDIKDTNDNDDVTCVRTTPTSAHIMSETFDSEMFEWTQRACSPELCSTPLKKQTVSGHQLDRMQGIEDTTNPEIKVALSNEAPSFEHARSSESTKPNVNAKGTRHTNVRVKIQKKKVRTHKVQRKRPKIPSTNVSSKDKIPPKVAIDPCQASKSLIQVPRNAELNKARIQRLKRSKRGNKFTGIAIPEVMEGLPTTSSIVKGLIQDKEGAKIVSPLLQSLETTNDILPDVRNSNGKRGKRTMLQLQKKHMRTSVDDSVAKILEVPDTQVDVTQIQNQEYRVSLQVLSECKEHSRGGLSRRCKATQKKPRKLKDQRLDGTVAVTIPKETDKIFLASMETTAFENNQTATKCSKKTKGFSLAAGVNVLKKCDNIQSQIRCSFCQSSIDSEVSGEMVHYFNDKPVAADYNGGVNVVHSHRRCTEWAPDVYFEDDLVINLQAELARSRRINCSCCGIKGAALGCYEKNCRRSFHFTCAKLTPECRWDNENFVMLCPQHVLSKLPNETSEPCRGFRKRSTPRPELQSPILYKPDPDISWKWIWPSGSPCKWVLCCSALTVAEKEIVSKFARSAGASVSKSWTSAVTHVIASTDANGACRRTLKFLMGILNGKWILGIDWIKECIKAMEPVDEKKFEVTLDIHGFTGGPQQGRLRITHKQPKLFDGYRFYFAGNFQLFYKGYLQDLVIAAGGSVLQRKPISRDQEKLLHDSPTSKTVIIYSIEITEENKHDHDGTVFNLRRAEAQVLANACGAEVASNSWILDSISACKLQPLA